MGRVPRAAQKTVTEDTSEPRGTRCPHQDIRHRQNHERAEYSKSKLPTFPSLLYHILQTFQYNRSQTPARSNHLPTIRLTSSGLQSQKVVKTSKKKNQPIVIHNFKAQWYGCLFPLWGGCKFSINTSKLRPRHQWFSLAST